MADSKKAQMEIFGLAVVVILLVLGMFLVISFSSRDSSGDAIGEFGESHLAQDFVTVLSDSITTCESHTMPDLIERCVIGTTTKCGTDACDSLETSLNFILDETLRLQGIPFRLTVLSGGSQLMKMSGNTAGEPLMPEQEQLIGREYLVYDLGTLILPLRQDVELRLELLRER